MIEMLGGYESFTFALVSIGCVLVGGMLMIWTPFVFPVPVFGSLLLAFYVTHECGLAMQTITDEWVNGFLGVVPIVFYAIEILCLFLILDGSITAYKERHRAIGTIENSPHDCTEKS